MLKKCFLIILLVLIVIPTICFNHEKNSASSVDNRMLSELSDLKLDTVNNYINDRIGFREDAINVYNGLNEKLFKVSTNPQLMMGKDGNLFPKIDSITVFNDYHELFLLTIKNMQDYCNDRGVDFYYMLDPSKASIISEELPVGMNYNTYWLDEFVARAKELGINIVDNYSYFKEIKNDTTLYNKKYDTYHWNDEGAFLGINNLLNTMGIEENKIDDYTKKDKAIDEDAVIDYLPNYRLTDYGNKYKNGLMMADDFKEFQYFKEDNNGPKLLSFEGSYLLTNDRTEKFIANKFSETVVVHDYQNIFNLNYYLNIYKPDIVLFEMADYTFQEYYFSMYYMETMQLQPSLGIDNNNIIETNEKLTYTKEINGEYVTYIIKNPIEDFDYKYLIVNNQIYDLYKYDNENIALTILLEDDFNMKDASVLTKANNSNDTFSYKLD